MGKISIKRYKVSLQKFPVSKIWQEYIPRILVVALVIKNLRLTVSVILIIQMPVTSLSNT